MGAIDPSIPLATKPPDFTTLGNIIGVARGAQQLQTGRIEQQRQSVQLQQEQGALDARNAVSKLMQDPEMRDPETGFVDLNKFGPAAQSADPKGYVWKDAFAAAASANADMMKLKGAALTLGNEQQSYIGQRMGAAALEPDLTKADVNSVLDDALRIAPASKTAVDIMRTHVNAVPDDPNVLRPLLTKYRNLAFPLSAQAPQTNIVGTGATAQPVQTNPLGGNVGPNGQPVQMAVPPTQAQTQKTDVVGQPYIEEKTPNGQIVNKPMPGQAPPLMAFPPGESPDSFKQFTAIRQEVNQAAAAVPTQHFNNQQIVRLAKEGYTGSTAGAWAKLLSANGLQSTPGDKTADFQQLGHFMALQAQANAKAMGVQNIPGQLTAELASGSTAWDAKAIERSAKINDALSTGVDFFNRGMEAAINNPGNTKSLFAARDFQNAWSKTFDVNAMRLHNAIANGDKEEQQTVISAVGGKNSAGAKALAGKLRALDALIGGQ